MPSALGPPKQAALGDASQVANLEPLESSAQADLQPTMRRSQRRKRHAAICSEEGMPKLWTQLQVSWTNLYVMGASRGGKGVVWVAKRGLIAGHAC